MSQGGDTASKTVEESSILSTCAIWVGLSERSPVKIGYPDLGYWQSWSMRWIEAPEIKVRFLGIPQEKTPLHQEGLVSTTGSEFARGAMMS